MVSQAELSSLQTAIRELGERITAAADELVGTSDEGVAIDLYEVERSAFTRSTYDRAIESLNAVNDEIGALIQRTWGRAPGRSGGPK